MASLNTKQFSSLSSSAPLFHLGLSICPSVSTALLYPCLSVLEYIYLSSLPLPAYLLFFLSPDLLIQIIYVYTQLPIYRHGDTANRMGRMKRHQSRFAGRDVSPNEPGREELTASRGDAKQRAPQKVFPFRHFSPGRDTAPSTAIHHHSSTFSFLSLYSSSFFLSFFYLKNLLITLSSTPGASVNQTCGRQLFFRSYATCSSTRKKKKNKR